MKVLVIGGSGLIGNAVTREMLTRGYAVTVAGRRPGPTRNLLNLDLEYVSADANDGDALRTLAKGKDAIVDSGAPYALRMTDVQSDRIAAERTATVLSAARKSGCRLVYVSARTTSASSGSAGNVQRRLSRRLHPYFRGKELAERMILEASESGANAVIVTPTACVGPWDVKPRQQCWVPALVNGDISITVEHKVNVVDTRDVATALVSILESDHKIGPIEISGHNTTIGDLFRHVCRFAGVRAPRLRVPAFTSVLPSLWGELAWARVGRAAPLPAIVPMLICEQEWVRRSPQQEQLGVAPRKFEDTVRDTVNWYRRLGYCE